MKFRMGGRDICQLSRYYLIYWEFFKNNAKFHRKMGDRGPLGQPLISAHVACIWRGIREIQKCIYWGKIPLYNSNCKLVPLSNLNIFGQQFSFIKHSYLITSLLISTLPNLVWYVTLQCGQWVRRWTWKIQDSCHYWSRGLVCMVHANLVSKHVSNWRHALSLWPANVHDEVWLVDVWGCRPRH